MIQHERVAFQYFSIEGSCAVLGLSRMGFGDLADVFDDLVYVLFWESREWSLVTWFMCCFGSLKNGRW